MKKVFVTTMLFLAATLTLFAQENITKKEKHARDLTKHYEQLSQKLNLNEQQLQSIKKIDQEHFAKLKEQGKQQQEFRNKNLALKKQIRAERDEQIKNVLTLEQYKQLSELKSKTKERTSSKHKAREHKRHHRRG